MAIAYRKIVLHAKRDQQESLAFEQWLNDNLIAFNLLAYEDPSECLAALSTWFRDDQDNLIVFAQAPVLTYDEVIWEAEDKSDAYIKSRYAISADQLPADFKQLNQF
jgi:hypothetical protein